MRQSIEGFRDLMAKTGSNSNSFIDIKPRWVDDDARKDSWYQMHSRSPRGSRIDEGSSWEVEFTIKKKELLAEYGITEERRGSSRHSLMTEFHTRPGESFTKSPGRDHGERIRFVRSRRLISRLVHAAPHETRALYYGTSTPSASFKIKDALMPRIVDKYHIKHCDRGDCRNLTISVNDRRNVRSHY